MSAIAGVFFTKTVMCFTKETLYIAVYNGPSSMDKARVDRIVTLNINFISECYKQLLCF